jgi:murein DD-endopeptidase MepM/ murein hydrolase activator NlpD
MQTRAMDNSRGRPVVRNFPRTTRRRVIATLVACSALLSFAAIPLASADDLRDRKNRVQGNISKAHKHLDQSSAKLMAATRALKAAQTKLSSAQKHLAKTRGELAAAEAFDKQMQAKLEAAVRALKEARAELVQGRAQVGEQQEFLGRIAVANYQSGDPNLLGLSMVLTSQNPAELTSQLNSVQNVLDKESMTLDRLEASRVLLTVQEEKVEKAKSEVAAQRAAAAENLLLKKKLEKQALKAEDRVARLVTERAAAEKVAADARAEDLAQLRDLQQERNRISALLKARAEEARRRQEAAAAAAARKAGRAVQSTQRRVPDGSLIDPVNGYVTSQYGMRFHPIYHRWSLHDGTDFGAGCGTPIRAAASGEVISVYFNTGYGNRVIIDHGYERGVGLGTAYNHLSNYSTFVGQHVERGEVIGFVGSTGYSTGCHLHFMVFENGATVNPMGWL